MVFKIGICDDNKELCEDLENILKQIEYSNNYTFEIILFYSIEDLMSFFCKKCIKLDILFLDIEFPEKSMNGIYMGDQIRNYFYNDTLKIIYISSYEKYWRNLFELQPFDFMIKPLFYKKIDSTIQKIIKILTKQRVPFEYNIMGEKYTVDLYKILYFQSMGRKIKIVTIDQQPPCYNEFYGKISEISKKLAYSDFFIIHKSYLVNYQNVKSFMYNNLELINGEALSISQSFRKNVRKMRNTKMGEK